MGCLTTASIVMFAAVMSSECLAAGAEFYSFVLAWPSEKVSSHVEFRYPTGIAVDPSGNVYVADAMGVAIQKFNASGARLGEWNWMGSDDGEFENAYAVAVDSKGNVFVLDGGNYRVQKFDSSGKFLWKCGEKGYREGQFYFPHGIAVDSSGNVFVAETERDKVLKFDSSGNFVMEWGSSGSGDGQFDSPHGVAVDAEGNVLVADSDNDRIQKYDSQGKFVMQWGERGSGDGEFIHPEGIAVDSKGNVYVTDFNGAVQKFDSSGKFLTKWGSVGSSEGYMTEAQALAIDFSGNVYVADTGNKRVQKFRPTTPPETTKEVPPEPEKAVPPKEKRKLSVDDIVLLKELGIEEQTVLKKVQDAGAVFSGEEIEKLRAAGFSEQFLTEVAKAGKRKPKLTGDNILMLHELGLSEESILKKIEETASTFSTEDVERFKGAGLSEDFVGKLTVTEAKTEKKKVKQETKKERKEKKVEPAGDGLAGSWQLKAAGMLVDLDLREDGSFSWHYKSADEVEDLKGTWKKVDDSTIEVTEEGSPTASLVPCKLLDRDTLQIAVEGVILQFKRK